MENGITFVYALNMIFVKRSYIDDENKNYNALGAEQIKTLREKVASSIAEEVNFNSIDLTDVDLSFLELRRISINGCKIDGLKLPKILPNLTVRFCEAQDKDVSWPSHCNHLVIFRGHYNNIKPTGVIESVEINECKINTLDLSSVKVDYLYLKDIQNCPTKCPNSLEYFSLRSYDMNNITLPVSARIDGAYLRNVNPKQTWLERGIESCFLVSTAHTLVKRGDMYSAGCVGPLTYEDALKYVSCRCKKHHIAFRRALEANPPLV